METVDTEWGLHWGTALVCHRRHPSKDRSLKSEEQGSPGKLLIPHNSQGQDRVRVEAAGTEKPHFCHFSAKGHIGTTLETGKCGSVCAPPPTLGL